MEFNIKSVHVRIPPPSFRCRNKGAEITFRLGGFSLAEIWIDLKCFFCLVGVMHKVAFDGLVMTKNTSLKQPHIFTTGQE